MKRVLIVAGGTGGHIFPGMAVGEALKAKGYQVSWLGSKVGMEAKLVSDHFEFHAMSIQGFRRKGLLSKSLMPLRLGQSILQAMRVIKRVKPDLVIGMGGFVAGPAGIAARIKRVPLIIHEQNARAGLTNRLLAKRAQLVLEAFPGSFPADVATRVVGNPVRAQVLQVLPPSERLSDRKGPLRILVVGGSLGAQAINNSIVTWFSGFLRRGEVDLWHQTGKRHFDDVQQAYRSHQLDVKVDSFIEDVGAALAWADLLICRAGAITVAEIADVGLASILVPMPNAVDDHQYHNAKYLVDQQAALLVPQSQLSSGVLNEKVTKFLDHRGEILNISSRARLLGKRDSTAAIVSACDELM